MAANPRLTSKTVAPFFNPPNLMMWTASPQRHQSAKAWSRAAPQRGRPSVKKFMRIGVDLAKNYFQVHALASESSPAVKRKLTRSKMHRFFSQIEPSFIGMEACGSAHYWARELKATGHDVLLMPPSYIKPYVKRGKNDAVDAEAICEAMSRPGSTLCSDQECGAAGHVDAAQDASAVGQAANDERLCAAEQSFLT